MRGIGIDLGLKDFAVFSNGAVVQAQRIYRDVEQQLGMAQRARKRRRVTAIHARLANRRLDFHHQLSARLMRDLDYIAVGNVNAAELVKSPLGKVGAGRRLVVFSKHSRAQGN